MLGRHDFWRAALTLGASAVKLAIVLSMLPGSLAGTVYVYKLLDFPPGIGIDSGSGRVSGTIPQTAAVGCSVVVEIGHRAHAARAE